MQKQEDEPRGLRAKILLIDGDLFFLKNSGEFLRFAGYDVDICQNVEEAFLKIPPAKPDCIILDAALPGSIDKILPLIRLQTPEIPLIVFMESDHPENPVFHDPGIKKVIRKPFDAFDLYLSIEEALRSKKMGAVDAD